MSNEQPTALNALYSRYASPEMARLFSADYRYTTWRRVWIALAESQSELGLPISEEQVQALRAAQDNLDLERVAELERETRHDVVAHLRHYAEQVDAETPVGAGGILHLGATSAFVTDNTDAVLLQAGLELLAAKLATVCDRWAAFADQHKELPCLAYTHFQPAQLTTVGKRAVLWLQDFLLDYGAVSVLAMDWPCRGAKGTTGTQASFLELFKGDHDKVRQLDTLFADKLGFARSLPVTGQTYTRKLDSRLLNVLAGIGESAHKCGTDIRLLQGVGELAEPFGNRQVGSSAMAYKRNPIRTERMCSLARRLLSDAANGPMTTAVQWLERSLDDSANRRLVLTDAMLTADAVLNLAGYIAGGLSVNEPAVSSRVSRELPFMATEKLLMEAVLRGGDRQELHEAIRVHSLAAQEVVAAGGDNPLMDSIAGDESFRMSREEIDGWMNPQRFVGRSPQQVEEFLSEVASPTLDGAPRAEMADPSV